MNKDEKWAEYVNAVIGTRSNAEIARLTGISKATIGRWRKGETRPDYESVWDFATALNLALDASLEKAGFRSREGSFEPPMSEHEYLNMPASFQLRRFTDVELAEEILRRVTEREDSMLNDPIDINVRRRPEDMTVEEIESQQAAATIDPEMDTDEPDQP